MLSIMAKLVNLSSYVVPIPIQPTAPNFCYCDAAYGTGLRRNDAIHAGALLPQGTRPVTYSVEEAGSDGLAANVSAPEYQLPFLESRGSVSIAIDVSGPVNIDTINVVPNDIRGMVAWVANECLGRRGLGGFVTRRIQGLVDFVTDPTSNIDASIYPDSTAFLTVTVSNHETSHAFPGDYDPQLAVFLRKAAANALGRVAPAYHLVIADRVVKFGIAMSRMRRLETEVPWWGGWLVQGKRPGTANVQLANVTIKGPATAHRRKKVRGFLR